MLDSPGAGSLVAGFSPGPVWVRVRFTGEGLPTWPPTCLFVRAFCRYQRGPLVPTLPGSR